MKERINALYNVSMRPQLYDQVRDSKIDVTANIKHRTFPCDIYWSVLLFGHPESHSISSVTNNNNSNKSVTSLIYILVVLGRYHYP